MNAKKRPQPSIGILDEAARRARRAEDKRLIACEKASDGDARITLLVDTQADAVEVARAEQGLPQGQEAVFEHLEKWADDAAIEVIVDLDEWSVELAALLAALRDRANRRILVHVGEARVGGDTDRHLVSLGYRRLSGGEALYLFDIVSYKDTPDWLSPRNWANPELWDKYRW